MKLCSAVLLGWVIVVVTGCGNSSGPGSLLLGDSTGTLDVLLSGEVDTAVDVNVLADVVGDVTCTVVCDLNTGECETVCELGEPAPPTPEALGEDLYVANCSACHGNPVGTGFAPDLSGESAGRILDELDSGSHPGGQFPNFTQEDIDNLAAFFATL